LIEKPIARIEWVAVLVLCAAASLAVVAWSWASGAMLNYGDAVAHLHIARRIFDSNRPGFEQLGSVWLPLPHILLLPFVQVYSWWANGTAALIPSIFAYLASCAGLYRLARNWLTPQASVLALIFFAANPNLLYLQTTAMTEPLFVCEMIWVVVWMVEWRLSIDKDQPRAQRLQAWIAFVLVCAIYTRYDGWIMALIAWTGIGVALLRHGWLRPGRRGAAAFWWTSTIVVAAPVVWFVYNAVCFGDWLEFMRGPYSAKAIEIRTATSGFPPHPGWHNLWVSLVFYIKAAEMDAVAAAWGKLLLVLSLLGVAWGWIIARRRAFFWTLLLSLPVPFYAYSVAYGSVPIFLPPWWPHSWYNTRYGMELLPALALGLGFAAQFFLAAVREFKPRWASYAAAILAVVMGLNACKMVRERPLVYVEGAKNLAARQSLEAEIPPVLRAQLARRPGGIILMNTSVYPRLIALTGIPFRQTINEGDYLLYRAALAAPADYAYLVLAFNGDDIDRAVKAHPCGLTALRRFSAPGQPLATLYISDTPPAADGGKPGCTVVASGRSAR
jgi:hypothetical protein